MALVHVIPLAEAAVFTAGCAVLNARRFNPERMGVALMVVAAVLAFALIVAATSTGAIPEPDEVYSVME